jgi:hypothetical protein
MTPSITPYQKTNPAFFVLNYKKIHFWGGRPEGSAGKIFMKGINPPNFNLK